MSRTTMNEKQLIQKSRKFVTLRFSNSPAQGLTYHNLEHTLYVAKTAVKIARTYNLSKEDLWTLEVAALFHDTGVTEQVEGHEEISVLVMKAFLEKEQVGDALIAKISALILATKLPQKPTGLLEEIICDADLAHLGKKSFYEKCENLRKEREFIQKKSINHKEWLSATLAFMEQHHYHTVYGISELDPGKAKNVALMEEKLKGMEKQSNDGTEQGSEKNLESHKDKDRDKPEKGIETMFRITSSNNQRLSDMADNKAHILITVNSIILSAIISLVLRRLDAYGYLAYPTFLLLAVSLVAMTFSILATRPSIPDGTYSQADFDLKQVNLLFFGNFYKMPLSEYTVGMMKIMDDKDFLYNTLIRDVYGQGAVLGKKYRLLRIAYNTFMYGLIASVLAFILVSAFHGGQVPRSTAINPLLH